MMRKEFLKRLIFSFTANISWLLLQLILLKDIFSFLLRRNNFRLIDIVNLQYSVYDKREKKKRVTYWVCQSLFMPNGLLNTLSQQNNYPISKMPSSYGSKSIPPKSTGKKSLLDLFLSGRLSLFSPRTSIVLGNILWTNLWGQALEFATTVTVHSLISGLIFIEAMYLGTLSLITHIILKSNQYWVHKASKIDSSGSFSMEIFYHLCVAQLFPFFDLFVSRASKLLLWVAQLRTVPPQDSYSFTQVVDA